MKVNDKVVCLDDNFPMEITSKWFEQLPIKNEIYTIREIRPAGAEGGILLNELRNKPKYFEVFKGHLEPAFSPKRFAPLAEVDNLALKEELEEVC